MNVSFFNRMNTNIFPELNVIMYRIFAKFLTKILIDTQDIEKTQLTFEKHPFLLCCVEIKHAPRQVERYAVAALLE